jgi:tetratricopeptide (TPR) repeat protein
MLFLVGDTEMEYGNARRSIDAYSEALETFESAPGWDQDARILRCIGYVRTAIGRYEGTRGNVPGALEMCGAAIKAYEKALGMDSKDCNAWYFCADAFLVAGELEAKQGSMPRSRVMYYRAIASYKNAIKCAADMNKTDPAASKGIREANRLLRGEPKSEYGDAEDEDDESEDGESGAGGATGMRPY